MTDRELLELAAKACGIDVGGDDFRDEILRKYEPALGLWVRYGSTALGHWWNPLTDDGDALRLAVKLNLAVTPYPIYDFPKHSAMVRIITMPVMRKEGELQIETIEPYSNDHYAATRRAIVRAAASIGEHMK